MSDKNNEICILSFIQSEENNIFFNKMGEQVQNYCVFKKVGIIRRGIRKLHIKSGLPGLRIWFNKWYNICDQFSTIVIVATEYSIPVLQAIYKKCKKKNVKLINYYQDEISISGYPVQHTDWFENWSFNKKNCYDYNMKYNPQFWIRSIDLKADKFIYDVSLIAADRNGKYSDRNKIVNELYNLFENDKYSIFFWYVTNSKEINSKIAHKNELSQYEFLKCIRDSKAIIEITENNNVWLTQRCLYAISNGKKLITNNKKIVEELFYNEKNIFILGKDAWSQMENFLSSPFENIDDSIIMKYELKAWLERFVDGVEFDDC